MTLTIHHTRTRHGDPLCVVRDLPGLDAEMTPADMLALARQLTYAAHDAQAGITGEHRYPEQEHPMTPGVIDARQQHEPNHPGRRADDADHSAQTLDMVQTDIIKRLRIKAGMIQMGERIARGSDSDLMYEAADMIERMMASEEQYTPADMADQGAKQFRAGQAGMYTAEDMCSQAAQGYRDGYAAAKAEDCPEGYVMVPMKPTPEWVANLRNIRIGSMESVIEDVLAAAPAVQGEPVGLRQRLFNGWRGCSNHGCVVVDPKPGMMRTNGSCQCVVNASRSQLYMLQSRIQSLMAAPQPSEQHPDDAAVDAFAAAMKAKLVKKRQEGRGGWQSMTAEQLSALLHEHVRKGDPVDVANLAMMLHQNWQRIEQHPDVAKLVEALDEAARSLETISRQAGIDEYMCDFLEVRGYARNRAMVAFEALAAYLKQQESKA